MGKIGDAPCLDCEERYFGCHCKCLKYKEFRAERDRQNIEKIKQAAIKYNPIIFSKSKRERIERRH